MIRFFTRKSNINFILAGIFTSLFSFLASIYFVWWSILITSFLVHLYFVQKPFKAFISGFISIFLLWFFLSLYLSLENNNILTEVVSNMFFNFYTPYFLNIFSGLIGGLVAGLSALTASHARSIWIKIKQDQTIQISNDVQAKINTSSPQNPIFFTNQENTNNIKTQFTKLNLENIKTSTHFNIQEKNTSVDVNAFEKNNNKSETVLTEIHPVSTFNETRQTSLSKLINENINQKKNDPINTINPSNQFQKESNNQTAPVSKNLKKINNIKSTKHSQKMTIPKSSISVIVPNISPFLQQLKQQELKIKNKDYKSH